MQQNEEIIVNVLELTKKMFENLEEDNSELFKKALDELKKIPDSKDEFAVFLENIGLDTKKDDSGHAFIGDFNVKIYWDALVNFFKSFDNAFRDYQFYRAAEKLAKVKHAKKIILVHGDKIFVIET